MNGTEGKKKQFNVAITEEAFATLEAINRSKQNTLPPTLLARGLIEAACQFYRDHGYFHFPVLLEPAPLRAAAEEAGVYGKTEDGAKGAAQAARLRRKHTAGLASGDKGPVAHK